MKDRGEDEGSVSTDHPLVYACSGCSSAAQLCNTLALRMDHQGLAEMSCIAGVGGGVPKLLGVARSGRPLLVLDGCPLHCALRCLAQQGITPTLHLDLSRHGVRRRLHTLADAGEEARVWEDVVLPACSPWLVQPTCGSDASGRQA